MNYKEKKEKIFDALTLQAGFFNPRKSFKKETSIQFLFKEPEGEYAFYLNIKNKTCELIEGKSATPVYSINTDIETWKKIGGGYISGLKAMKNGKLKIEGKSLSFVLRHKKIFSGRSDWTPPDNRYIKPREANNIKKVLVLSSSPRREEGATHLLVEKLISGMKKAGAEIEVLFPAKMKIHPCIGCFECWVKNTDKCIYHDKDDMKIFLEKFQQCDLIVWATPIYIYHCTSLMKIILDRLFISADSHYTVLENGEIGHPRKIQFPPYQMLLAGAGHPGFEAFKPLQNTLKMMEKKMGGKLIAELLRPTCMSFLLEDHRSKKKDTILDALDRAGTEVIRTKKVKKKTKKIFQQDIYSDSIFISAANTLMDKMIQEKKLIFKRNH